MQETLDENYRFRCLRSIIAFGKYEVNEHLNCHRRKKFLVRVTLVVERKIRLNAQLPNIFYGARKPTKREAQPETQALQGASCDINGRRQPRPFGIQPTRTTDLFKHSPADGNRGRIYKSTLRCFCICGFVETKTT